MTLLRPTFLALLLGLAATGAVAQQGPQPVDPAPEPRPIEVAPAPGTDAAIAGRLEEIIEAIGSYPEVSVAVEAGVVTLSGRVPETTDGTRLEELAERIEGVVTVENGTEATDDVADRLTPAFARLETRLRALLGFLPLVVVGVLVFALIAGVGMLVTRGRGVFSRMSPNGFVAEIYRQILRVVFLFAGILVALEFLGAASLLGTLLGAAGIIGLAIGFGVRDTIENFVASVMLSLRQPFQPNDLVEIEGETGHVIRLTSRATVLLSPDGNHIRIPNAVVFKSKIRNYTRRPERRFLFDLGVDPDADIAAAQATGLDALRRLDFVLRDPPAQVWVENVGESNVVLRFAGWVDQMRTEFVIARGEAIRLTKAAIEAAGFALPEPIYRLRIDRNWDGTKLAEPAPAARPAPARRTEPATRAEKDETLERKVAEERESTGHRDLLRPDTPSE